jgi:hypothetical protein
MIGDTELEQRIRQRAHQIWEEEGRPEGRDQEHWCRAEQETTLHQSTAPPLQPDNSGGRAAVCLVDQGEGLPPLERLIRYGERQALD